MASIKEALLEEAKELKIEVEEADTNKTLQAKIDAVKKGENPQPVNKGIVDPAKRTEVAGLKRIKVTKEQLKKLQAEGKLYGYDPQKEEALIK